MENKINVAELLHDCPKGMELDCAIWDNCTFDGIEDVGYINILVKTPTGQIKLSKEGCFVHNCNSAKCVIFPKGKTTWEGFHRPFKDGDILIHGDCTFIYNGFENDMNYGTYVIIDCYGAFAVNISTKKYGTRFTTEEEKQKLFDAIKANGYKWNPETKTLEKLPKFKVGDKIRCKADPIFVFTITNIIKDKYECGKSFVLRFTNQDDYELVPNKFDITTLKAFDKVLVRHNKDNKWCCSFFSHIDEDLHSHCYKFVTTAGKSYPYCIPYEGNQELRGTTNDCDEYYKTWEK